MKMFRSEQLLQGKMKAAMQEFGYTGGKACVICKCETQSEANKKAKMNGLGSRWFLPGCCEEVHDKDGLNLFTETDMAVCVDGKNYLEIEDIRDKLLR
jgi:hypothetical protein